MADIGIVGRIRPKVTDINPTKIVSINIRKYKYVNEYKIKPGKANCNFM